MLRAYQQEAHDKAISFVKGSTDSCVIEAPTGSGKSHVIAAIAHTLFNLSKGKKILCLAPSSELVIQNRKKYLLTGNSASLFSSSAGKISLRHPIVFGTPKTVLNRIDKFGDDFCAVVIDEAHGLTQTIKEIIEELKKNNENLRVIGLSATPYRMGTGYIYAIDEKDKPLPIEQSIKPYFTKKVYTISARRLISEGFLTVPVIGSIGTEHYDTSKLELNSLGKYDKTESDIAYVGQGRKTASIIAEIVAKAKDRKGVIIFTSTIKHAEECLDSLPKGISAIVTGSMPKADRKATLEGFLAKKIK